MTIPLAPVQVRLHKAEEHLAVKATRTIACGMTQAPALRVMKDARRFDSTSVATRSIPMLRYSTRTRRRTPPAGALSLASARAPASQVNAVSNMAVQHASDVTV